MRAQPVDCTTHAVRKENDVSCAPSPLCALLLATPPNSHAIASPLPFSLSQNSLFIPHLLSKILLCLSLSLFPSLALPLWAGLADQIEQVQGDDNVS